MEKLETLEGKFTIQVDGQSIGEVEDIDEPQVQASLEQIRTPAIFTLSDGRLETGNWILARSLIEDRSLLPKKIFWFNKQHSDLGLIHKTFAVPKEDSDSYELKFPAAPLIVRDGVLFVDLMGEEQQEVKILMQ